MPWCSGTHYDDIYNPAENPSHGRTRYAEEWDTLDDGTPICYKRYTPYEGYGPKSQEMFDFRISINKDHPLWSQVDYEKGGNKVMKKGDYMEKSLVFNEEAEVRIMGDNAIIREMIDSSDRHERISWNFSLMLANFVEKCSHMDRPSFFEEGFHGQKWSRNVEMMKDFKRLFDWIDMMRAADKNKGISLADQSVKDYPFGFYEQIKELYLKYMEKKLGTEWCMAEEKNEKKIFKLNPNAAVFIPSVIFPPSMEKTSPQKPEGPTPEKTRPRSTSGPDHLMPWRICEESDKKILELDRKIQMLINLHGPIVEAHHI